MTGGTVQDPLKKSRTVSLNPPPDWETQSSESKSSSLSDDEYEVEIPCIVPNQTHKIFRPVIRIDIPEILLGKHLHLQLKAATRPKCQREDVAYAQWQIQESNAWRCRGKNRGAHTHYVVRSQIPVDVTTLINRKDYCSAWRGIWAIQVRDREGRKCWWRALDFRQRHSREEDCRRWSHRRQD